MDEKIPTFVNPCATNKRFKLFHTHTHREVLENTKEKCWLLRHCPLSMAAPFCLHDHYLPLIFILVLVSSKFLKTRIFFVLNWSFAWSPSKFSVNWWIMFISCNIGLSFNSCIWFFNLWVAYKKSRYFYHFERRVDCFTSLLDSIYCCILGLRMVHLLDTLILWWLADLLRLYNSVSWMHYEVDALLL